MRNPASCLDISHLRINLVYPVYICIYCALVYLTTLYRSLIPFGRAGDNMPDHLPVAEN